MPAASYYETLCLDARIPGVRVRVRPRYIIDGIRDGILDHKFPDIHTAFICHPRWCFGKRYIIRYGGKVLTLRGSEITVLKG